MFGMIMWLVRGNMFIGVGLAAQAPRESGGGEWRPSQLSHRGCDALWLGKWTRLQGHDYGRTRASGAKHDFAAGSTLPWHTTAP